MKSQKRQDLPRNSRTADRTLERDDDRMCAPGVYVVATPIGTLGDLSPRARGVLAASQLIVCEDTRVTRKLLSSQGISAPELVRLDAQAESSGDLEGVAHQVEKIVFNGDCVSLVSDAGTPSVSDPGARLVGVLRERGVRLWSVPGPSALSAFVAIAGISAAPLIFWEFVPRHAKERTAWIAGLRAQSGFHVAFEAPHRLQETLEALDGALAPGESPLRVVLGKELSKQFERVEILTQGGLVAFWEGLKAEERQGEWVLGIIQIRDNKLENSPAISDGKSGSEKDWMKVLRVLVNAGVSASVAVKEVCQEYDAKRSEVYDYSLLLKNNK